MADLILRVVCGTCGASLGAAYRVPREPVEFDAELVVDPCEKCEKEREESENETHQMG